MQCTKYTLKNRSARCSGESFLSFSFSSAGAGRRAGAAIFAPTFTLFAADLNIDVEAVLLLATAPAQKRRNVERPCLARLGRF